MFQLMDANKLIANVKVSEGEFGPMFEIVEEFDELPIGVGEVGMYKWYKERVYNNKYVRRHGLDDLEIINQCIRETHCSTLIDTFWLKSETESITWNEVSNYVNYFNDSIEDVCLTNECNLRSYEVKGNVPTFGTSGCFPKRWVKYTDGTYLYKRNPDTNSNCVISEVIASDIFSCLCDSVKYSVTKYKDVEVSVCKNFTNESKYFVPYSLLGVINACVFYDSIGCGNDYRRMLVADFVCNNPDRHYSNHGILVEGTDVTMSPVFDMNMCFTPSASDEDVTCASKLTEGEVACIKRYVSDDILSDLKNMYPFPVTSIEEHHKRCKNIGEVVNRRLKLLVD